MRHSARSSSASKSIVTFILAMCASVPLYGFMSTSVQAQASNICDQGRKLLQERQNIITQINSWAKKKIDPNTACSIFGRLQNNGSATLKWMESNKDWCQIPDDAVANLTTAQGQIVKNRNGACQAAAQFNKAKKEALKQAQQRAAQQQQGGGGGAFGGSDQVTGGALPVPRSPL
jgi:hypothetical protein